MNIIDYNEAYRTSILIMDAQLSIQTDSGQSIHIVGPFPIGFNEIIKLHVCFVCDIPSTKQYAPSKKGKASKHERHGVTDHYLYLYSSTPPVPLHQKTIEGHMARTSPLNIDKRSIY
ncbi:hypothetical protein CEXT_803941 [Caerostris extrusa]|uniref:Uncharacterized protein n=1 Tax=Caerostris extrusa TaxID=172846 RepID=A0AAV4Y0D1_CAEEX|nr:hypothetical protein CEXT_803941 [Caerostris extrusa]